MPKAVRFHRLGGPEVLQIEEVPVRHPETGEDEPLRAGERDYKVLIMKLDLGVRPHYEICETA